MQIYLKAQAVSPLKTPSLQKPLLGRPLNVNGTWKHGFKDLTKNEIKTLSQMDASYHNEKEQFIKFLKKWINKVISERLWINFVDLHIDEVYSEFNNRKKWISGSIFLLKCIMSLIDNSKYDVILAIPLSCISGSSHIDFKELKEIENELDLTPPSFYLFPKGERNYDKTISDSKYLIELSKQENLAIYYNEKEEEKETYRTVFIKFF